MFCPKCAADLKEGVRFCPKCGLQIKEDQAEQLIELFGLDDMDYEEPEEETGVLEEVAEPEPEPEPEPELEPEPEPEPEPEAELEPEP
ncbi:MAG: zinc ribbon domain-containing protein, partial [Lachnospiraceae bacterium]|nr:zinc ribbon domain-containing protein [Lachnospiraceae bacterium]